MEFQKSIIMPSIKSNTNFFNSKYIEKSSHLKKIDKIRVDESVENRGIGGAKYGWKKAFFHQKKKF